MPNYYPTSQLLGDALTSLLINADALGNKEVSELIEFVEENMTKVRDLTDKLHSVIDSPVRMLSMFLASKIETALRYGFFDYIGNDVAEDDLVTDFNDWVSGLYAQGTLLAEKVMRHNG